MNFIKNFLKNYKDILYYTILAIFIGILVGSVDAIFGIGLIKLSEFRDHNILLFISFLPLAGLLIVLLYRRFGKRSNKGMHLVFETGHGTNEKIPKRSVPLVIITTWLTHLFGGSAGREGVAIQLGATISHTIGRKLKLPDNSKVLLITGMAAGFAGLFQTPLAGTFFAMEVLIVGSLAYEALLPALVASYVASYTSHAIGLEKFFIHIDRGIDFEPGNILKLIVIGIIFGIVGGSFAAILDKSKAFFSKIMVNPYSRIFIMACAISIFLLLAGLGRYAGLGTNLISNSLNGSHIYSYDWLFKFILTILTLSAGFQGGEVTPLFAIGASLGFVLGGIFGLSPILIGALGYAAIFGSATNTLLAPILIGAEVFGSETLPLFIVVCSLAYVFNGNKSIYSLQKKSRYLDTISK